MRRMAGRPILTLAAALALAWLAPVMASADEKADAQAVIESQIEAFLANDAEAAYSFAAPGIKEIYPNTERFFEMVKRGYQPVYRPDNFAFGRMKTLDGGLIVQEVLIAGPDGEDWTAIYVLEKVDGTFKIRGVQMVKSAAPAI